MYAKYVMFCYAISLCHAMSLCYFPGALAARRKKSACINAFTHKWYYFKYVIYYEVSPWQINSFQN